MGYQFAYGIGDRSGGLSRCIVAHIDRLYGSEQPVVTLGVDLLVKREAGVADIGHPDV